MFEYFPENFGWSFAVSKALAAGGQMEEIDRVCKPLQALANSPAGAQAWIEGWSSEARRMNAFAQRDEEMGHTYGAARKYLRSSIYFITAEARTPARDPRRRQNYVEALEAFRKGILGLKEPLEHVEVPYGDTTLPALFSPVPGARKAPCIVMLNGFDSVKEFNYLTGLPEALRRHGIAMLLIDHPGTGAALRLQHLKGNATTEVSVGAALDYLVGRDDVDADRLGLVGISLGGYYAPRAAAFEKRLRLCVAWGAVWNYGAICRSRIAGSTTGAVYADWLDQFQFVFGDDMDAALAMTDQMESSSFMDKITCPLLILHGANDRQVSADNARSMLAAATSSDAELKLFGTDEGGTAHSQFDNVTLAVDYITGWISKRFPLSSSITRQQP